MGHRCAVALLASLALVLPACGSDDAPLVPEVERKAEAVDELPKLPRGFEPYLSPVAGFALGRPPGWKASEEGAATLMLAPDRLVALTISADRTNEALAADPEQLALDTFTALPGYDGALEPSDPEPFRHPYDAYVVSGAGVAADTGIEQRIRVIVLLREGVAVLTATIAENADEGAKAEVDQALDAVRALRSRPV